MGGTIAEREEKLDEILSERGEDSFPLRSYWWASMMMSHKVGEEYRASDVYAYLKSNNSAFFKWLIRKKLPPTLYELHSVGFKRWFKSMTYEELSAFSKENLKMMREWVR